MQRSVSRDDGRVSSREDYAARIKDRIEAYMMKLRRGKFAVKDNQSLSITAARECASILRMVVESFHEAEMLPNSRSMRTLKAGAPAVEVATQQVATLLRHITRAGAAMQRSPHLKLLLTNVTRRVLSILRDAAEQSMATEGELETIANDMLRDLPTSDDDDEDDDDGFVAVEAPSASPSTARQKDEETGPLSDDDCCIDSDDDVELEGVAPSSSATSGAHKSHTGGPLTSNPASTNLSTAKPSLSRGVKFDDDATAKSSKPIAVAVKHAEPATERAHEPGSLLSDFLAPYTPPKQMLTRAPSILGEVDTAVVKEYPVKFEDFIARGIDGIRGFEEELAFTTQELGKRAARQLHPLDTVITLGTSHSTASFLLRAAEDACANNASGSFKVIILEGRPLRGVHRLADMLREKGVEVRVLPDSSAFAVMSTCTKAVIGVENVLANGGLLAPIGTHPLCVAAKHFCVPVMVVTMTLKMTPYYPSDNLCTSLVKLSRSSAEELPWSTFAYPGDVYPTSEWSHVDPTFLHELDVPNPLMEYVPPQLVTLFATNEGEYTVPQIHRIVRDNYNVEDGHL